MKVYIGPYKDGWIGPYQIADTLKVFGVSEDRCDAIGDYLNSTWVSGFCKWVYDHNPMMHRKIKIRIDHYDVWNMDATLAHIIHPMLIMLKKDKCGGPYVDDADVPEGLRSTAAPPKKNKWDIDAFHFDRFDWILDEMIWSFDHAARQKEENSYDFENEDDIKKYWNMEKRVDNGRLLFGKYFRTLWS